MAWYLPLLVSYCEVCRWWGLWEEGNRGMPGSLDCPWCEARDSLVQRNPQ